MYIYIFKKMVTWLQIEFFSIIGMGFDVTKAVTKWLHGYKGSSGIF